MRIAVVHGYFLQGTGSNLFVANMCRELCMLGHEVLLFSQEQNSEKLGFVSKAIGFAEDNREQVTIFERRTDYAGMCTCYRPDLNGMLPVYVYDKYAGYQVKTFPELSRGEIEEYIDRNRAALCTVFADLPPDLILSNHIIMQPVYVHRAQAGTGPVPHFVTVHGSCLNFSVRRSELLKEYAQEAIDAVDRLVFVSKYSQREFAKFFANLPEIKAKSRVISAGVDVNYFQPLAAEEEKPAHLRVVEDYLRGQGIDRKAPQAGMADKEAGREMWLPDAGAAERLRALQGTNARLVLYFGKYLWTKGIHLLIAAAPLVLAEHPDTHFILTGFGEFRTFLENMVAALHAGDSQTFCALIEQCSDIGPKCPAGSALYFQSLLRKLAEPEFHDKYFSAAIGKIAKQVIFTGFLPHEFLRELIMCADAAVVPSIFPEAFGLVAIEALAAGVIPLQTNHSGFSEVIAKYSKALKPLFPHIKLVPLYLDEHLVVNLADNICRYLALLSDADHEMRRAIRQRAREVALEYSWTSMTQQYLRLLADKS